MSDVRKASTEELTAELTRRGAMPRCRCGKWPTYVGIWDHRGNTRVDLRLPPSN
jgi:hypothetical protein